MVIEQQGGQLGQPVGMTKGAAQGTVQREISQGIAPEPLFLGDQDPGTAWQANTPATVTEQGGEEPPFLPFRPTVSP
jgi:hypothetical protein